jgi:hypothetical protein
VKIKLLQTLIIISLLVMKMTWIPLMNTIIIPGQPRVLWKLFPQKFIVETNLNLPLEAKYSRPNLETKTSFVPLKMEQRMLSLMPRADKESDKNLSRLLYRFSSVIRPIDNTLRIVYATKPEEESGEQFDKWLQLEQTVLNSRALAMDALSFGNDL